MRCLAYLSLVALSSSLKLPALVTTRRGVLDAAASSLALVTGTAAASALSLEPSDNEVVAGQV